MSFCQLTCYLFAECGSVVKNRLKSPGYPKYYPNNTDCDYLVYIPQEMTMNITFIDFKLEESSECR